MRAWSLVAGLWVVWAGGGPAFAADRYALVVTGASGGPEYGAKYDGWRSAFVSALSEKLGYPREHIVVLAENEEGGARRATRDNVRAALADIARRAGREDVVTILLIGHGTAEGHEDAKFNLVGPDLTAGQWSALVKPIAARIVFVNGASGSFPFMEALAGRNRVVVTANDSAQQQFETVFPGLFVAAFGATGADLDKNGKVSVLEAFNYASAGVKDFFESRGQLPTERPLLDDTGDGVGREAEPARTAGRAAADDPADGTLAHATYLQPETIVPAAVDAELAARLKERAAVESRIESLKINKPNVTPAEYEDALERLLLDLARLDRLIRSRS